MKSKTGSEETKPHDERETTLCQHREDGQICIRMKDHEGPHVLAPDTTDEIAGDMPSPAREGGGLETSPPPFFLQGWRALWPLVFVALVLVAWIVWLAWG